MVWRTLFCSLCNFDRWVSAANSQAGTTMRKEARLSLDVTSTTLGKLEMAVRM
jgi:hypothetical protein